MLVGYVGNAAAVLDGPPPDTLEREARAAGVVERCEAAVRALNLTPGPVLLPPQGGPPTVPGRDMTVLRDGTGRMDWTLGVPVEESAFPICHVDAGGHVTVQNR